MSTADELLAGAFTSEALKVDLVNRVIIIPESVKHLGVTSDEDVMKLPFEMPRFYGNLDLTKFEINVNYKNAKGYGDVYTVKEMVVEPELITFWWQIDRFVVGHPGKVKFSVCLKNPDASESDGIGQELNTQPAELPVLEGLETSESIPEQAPYLYRELLERVKDLENKVASGNVGGKDETNYIIHGKWLLNSPVNLAGTTGKTVVKQANIKYGPAYNKTIVGIVAVEDIGVGYALDTDENGNIMVTDYDGVWVDETYRYLDFGTGKSVSAEFYTWFMSNATKAPAETVYSISGKWVLNSPVVLTGATGKCMLRDINIKTGILYDIPVYGIFAVEDVGTYYATGTAESDVIAVTDFDGVFADSKYRYLDFGEGVVVSKEFYEWFLKTAVQGVYDEEYDGDIDIVDPDNPDPDEPDIPDVPEVKTYSVTNNLVGCSNSNASATVNEGASYAAVISANEGYNLGAVTVLMGGEDITAKAYSEGVVAIYAVTGDIVINATAATVNVPTTYYTLNAVGNGDFSIYVNGDTSNAVRSTSGKLQVSYVHKFKLVPSSMVSYENFTAGDPDSGGDSLAMVPDADGWYILTQEITAHIAVNTAAFTIEGKYLMNYKVTLPPTSVTSATTGDAVGGMTGVNYDKPFQAMTAMGTGVFFNINGESVHAAIASGNEATFVEEGYRYVNFTKQVVSKEFYNWLYLNSVDASTSHYSITNSLTNCKTDNPISSIPENASYVANLIGNENILGGDPLIVARVKVTMGGIDITNDVYWEGKIIITHVTGDVVITAYATSDDLLEVYDMDYELHGATLNSSLIAEINEGASYSNLVHPDDGYAINSVKVTMDGVDVTSRVYSYNEESGVGEISIACVSGDITIEVVSIAISDRTLSGKWLLNECIDISSTRSTQVTAKTGSDYSITVEAIIVFGTGLYYHIDGTNVRVAPQTSIFEGVFGNSEYRYLDFGTEPQTVGEAFYNWLITNAIEL